MRCYRAPRDVWRRVLTVYSGWRVHSSSHYNPSYPVPTTIFGLVPKLGLTPVFVDDTSTVSGVAARHFTFTATWTQAMIDDDVANNISTSPLGTVVFVLDYYDSIATHYPLRIFSNSTLLGTSMFVDIISFTPDLHVSAQSWPGPAVNNSAFNITECPKMKTHLMGSSRYPKATPNAMSGANGTASSDTTSASSSSSSTEVHFPAVTSADEYNQTLSSGRHLLQSLGNPKGSFADMAATCLYLSFPVGPFCVFLQPCGSFSRVSGSNEGAALFNMQIFAHSTYVSGGLEVRCHPITRGM